MYKSCIFLLLSLFVFIYTGPCGNINNAVTTLETNSLSGVDNRHWARKNCDSSNSCVHNCEGFSLRSRDYNQVRPITVSIIFINYCRCISEFI